MNSIQAEKNLSLYLDILQRNSGQKRKASKQFDLIYHWPKWLFRGKELSWKYFYIKLAISEDPHSVLFLFIIHVSQEYFIIYASLNPGKFMSIKQPSLIWTVNTANMGRSYFHTSPTVGSWSPSPTIKMESACRMQRWVQGVRVLSAW